MSDIVTSIKCSNIAPIENLVKDIKSSSLKIGVFANNGSGKTYISRIFRLTEKDNHLFANDDGSSPTDKLIRFGKNNADFGFKIIDKHGVIKEDLKIQFNKNALPIIPKTNYIYHTFNQDYVEDNIRDLNYDKNSEIEGFILGKINIDIKEEEEKLVKLEKDGRELKNQIESEINSYVEKNIGNIQDIKRLSEFKILKPENIFDNVDKENLKVKKTHVELITDYNKIKSVPENLVDIGYIPKLNIDLTYLNQLKDKLEVEYSLSDLANEFKDRIKSKQDFVEKGIQLIAMESKDACPFCEQKLETNALDLIDQYTKYLNDTEATTIKELKGSSIILEKYLADLNNVSNINTQRTIDFNTYKTKYIPSSGTVELNNIVPTELNNDIERLNQLINEKVLNISKRIDVSDGLINSLAKNLMLINRFVDLNNESIKAINSKKRGIGEESKQIRNEICRSAFNHLLNHHRTNIKNVLKFREEWTEVNNDIKAKKEQQKISKKSLVASTIKKVLNYFFDQKYSLDEDTFRLIFNTSILEKNQAKDVLSEGEKSIIAFAYFLGDTHIKVESDEEYQKIFFVIDDPISSMDFSHVYTMCGVIRDITKIIDKLSIERLLIFTHNNDFMRVLSVNNVIDKKLLLKNGEIADFNSNLTVPYIHHLVDIYKIARKNSVPSHTTANSIRHIVETLTKFEKIDMSGESIAQYLRDNIPTDKKSYTLINDLSHGGWRTEQAPIGDDDYRDVCEAIILHIEIKYNGQITYCEKLSV